jgi:hypothetical protein
VAIGETEIDEAVDAFRIAQSLHSGAATQQWLDDTGLTMTGLRELMASRLERREFREGIVEKGSRTYFDAHRPDFDVLMVLRCETASGAVAQIVVQKARFRRIVDGTRRRSAVYNSHSQSRSPLPP